VSHLPRTVLVTGAGGFIGAHLVRDQLGRGRSVVAVDVDLQALASVQAVAGLTLAATDIRSTAALAPLLDGVDTVFHLAAAHLDVHKDSAYFEAVNVGASRDLARLAAAGGVGRFVHCSTVGVYGPLARLPADENTPPAPDIDYERTKLAGETAVRDVAGQTGVATVIVRPAWVFGPGCPRTLKLIRSIARRRFAMVGNGATLRHPLYVTDLLEAFELAATRPLETPQTLLVAGPEPISLSALVAVVAEALNMRYRPPRVPLWLMAGACATVERGSALIGIEPPFSRRSLKFFTESSAFDTSRARRLLGFEPRVSTREGIALTVAHYRAVGAL
jgi:nucleoside-diphosphate-sugar epimerase